MGHEDSSPDLHRLADEDLISLIEDGDADAFEVVYDRHARTAYSLAFRLLGDRAAAEDLTQDAFLLLWRRAERYAPARGSVRTWLLSLVHHRGVDRLRTVGAVARRQEVLESEARGSAASPDTAADAVGRAMAADVRQELTRLPDAQSQVLRLAYYGGYTHQEIADMLGLRLGTVKSRMRLGLDRLRQALSAGGGR